MRYIMMGTFIVAGLVSSAALAHTDLTVSQVKALLDAGTTAIVVDVREESEFCDSNYTPPGHIAGAVNMPWNSGYLQANYTELDPNDSTIIVCRSGSRSNSAANFLDGQGFTKVFDMLGGMNAWSHGTELCAPAGVPGTGGDPSRGLMVSAPSPNPFDAETRLTYHMPAVSGPTPVGLTVLDARGRIVRRSVSAVTAGGSGQMVWDGDNAQGQPAPSGVYFLRLTWAGESKIRRTVLLR
jgi:rhodanese-related sulfurtransferase